MRLAIVVVAPLAALSLLAAGVIMLDRHSAYHSPLAASSSSQTPRSRALERTARASLASSDGESEHLAAEGRAIAAGKGLCLNCHTFGDDNGGTMGPDLRYIGAAAGRRVRGLGDIAYLAESLVSPDSFIVPGYAPGMIGARERPIELSDSELLRVVAYLQSLGSTPTVTSRTELPSAPQIAGVDLGW